MTARDRTEAMDSSTQQPRAVVCEDLDAAIARYAESGYRLDMIMPADSPRIALVSKDGVAVRLEVRADREAPVATSESSHGFAIARADASEAWLVGRVGMRYRDLIPYRLGGRCMASQIRIPDAGPVPDYVHYHKVGFQMIYCKSGWVRVVYEDQGPPFVMRAGDCVLQPPTIRHRVLESSPGLEVVEIGCPAEHETWREHELELPTAQIRPERRFGGQRFVRHVASDAPWQRGRPEGHEYRDIGIFDATDGLADVRVVRLGSAAHTSAAELTSRMRETDFVFVLPFEGELRIASPKHGAHTLVAGDACTIDGAADFVLEAGRPCELLAVAVARMDSGG